jgi:hypothetical protein
VDLLRRELAQQEEAAEERAARLNADLSAARAAMMEIEAKYSKKLVELQVRKWMCERVVTVLFVL